MKKYLLFIIIITLLGCDDNSNEITDPALNSSPTNYSNAANWATYTTTPIEEADVFYIHPTTYYSSSDGAPNNWEINQTSETALYAYGAVISQVSIFDGIANYYAPFYRQVRVHDFVDLPEVNSEEFKIAYNDVKAAFEYFFENNNGRPFFIMGHSQGAHMGLLLIKDLFSQEKYLEKLIAAYIIGWPITQDDLSTYPHLKVLSSPGETGGIAAWDVVAENATMVLPTKAQNSIMVNPLTWTLTKDPVPKEYNLGAVFFGMQGSDYIPIGIEPEFTGGQIKEMPAIPGYFESEYTSLVTPNLTDKLTQIGAAMDEYSLNGCYHTLAVNMFYNNIVQNALERKQAYFSK